LFSINKSDLIRITASNSGVPLQDVDSAVDILLEVLADALADDERIEIRGFGAFTIP
jgi:nucleoid DNA-binding protein